MQALSDIRRVVYPLVKPFAETMKKSGVLRLRVVYPTIGKGGLRLRRSLILKLSISNLLNGLERL